MEALKFNIGRPIQGTPHFIAAITTLHLGNVVDWFRFIGFWGYNKLCQLEQIKFEFVPKVVKLDELDLIWLSIMFNTTA